MNYINRKKGISLIVLMVIVLVIVVLASTVILNISKSNPIDEARLSKLLNTKEVVEANLKLYASENLTKTDGKMKPVMTFTGKDDFDKTVDEFDAQSRDNEIKLKELVITDTTNKTLIETENTEIYLLDNKKYEKNFANKEFTTGLPKEKWYVDKLGNVYLVLEKNVSLPIYLKNAINKKNNLINFIYYLDGTDSTTGLELLKSILN